MRVLKDQIFERVRAYSPVQLLDFLLIRMPAYYERRLTDVINGRLDMFISKRYLPGNGKIDSGMISRVEESGVYLVMSESNPDHKYEVDMVHGMCTCHVGLNGAPCKHQYAVMKYHNIRSFNFLPVNDERMRIHLLYLATGTKNVPEGWFSSLGSRPDVIDPPQEVLPGSTECASTEELVDSQGQITSLEMQRQMQNRFDGRHFFLAKHRQQCCEWQCYKCFSCKYCDKEYVSLGALKMHIRTHTLPCVCKLCGKAFSRPWLLQGHIRTHTGEKPFSCPHCSRAFADRSNLRAHLQTHSDIKKYQCKVCSKTFSRVSLLSKHEEAGCCPLS
ncbi:hypothetical protein GJAV_G00245110 [Gymnothorax javanicus]|nr:hypothetical protein GJAV_G00245110 [Gymnothorax javanicus]